MISNHEKEVARDVYVTAHIQELWTMARAGYTKAGRGLLVIEGDTGPLGYVPLDMLPGDGEYAVLGSDVVAYNPETEFVLLYDESSWGSSLEVVIRVVL